MKTILILSLIVFNTNLFSQDTQETEMFSKFKLSILGGTNFNTIPTIGGSIRIEGKTNISNQINIKLSAGFSSIFENKEYMIKSYEYIKVENVEGYRTKTHTIDQIQYSVIPLNLGLEYIFVESKISPFAVFELGYNFYTGEEQIVKGLVGGEIFNNENEVPFEYRNPAPKPFDDSTIGIGIGIGIKYNISSSFELSISYQYRYYETLINNNQILLGVAF